MKLIIWLGNPWETYTYTRHNIGFLCLDYLNKEFGGWNFQWENRFEAEISQIVYNQEKTLLVKPQTFMNLSWNAVLKLMSFYKIEKKDIIVLFDDASLEMKKVRYREKWSAGGQNGVKSIIQNIWEEFARIKIWIGNQSSWDLSDWVLSKISPKELQIYQDEIFPLVKQLLLQHF